jgi:hypothetical protein
MLLGRGGPCLGVISVLSIGHRKMSTRTDPAQHVALCWPLRGRFARRPGHSVCRVRVKRRVSHQKPHGTSNCSWLRWLGILVGAWSR